MSFTTMLRMLGLPATEHRPLQEEADMAAETTEKQRPIVSDEDIEALNDVAGYQVLGELRPPETSCVDDGRDPFQGESPTEHDRRL